MEKQINNITDRVVDDLRERLSYSSRLSIAAASFSIYAFEALKKELESIPELRFIFTAPTFTHKEKKEKREYYIPKLNRERNVYGTDFEIRLRNQLSQKAVAKECAEWIKNKVKFKSNSTGKPMYGFLHVKDNAQYVYIPFNEFTTTELGSEKGNNVYQICNMLPSPMAEIYLKTFNELWENDENFPDVTNKVLDYIQEVYQENSPEYIYLITLYNIFKEFLADLSEDVLPNERTGFKSSAIWNKLYNFQKDAVLAIINKLEKFNGCILADSVGLGKTFTALAVIKYYEGRNKNVLVLCPKKLNENWQTFRANYKNNPIVADRLRYDILFHSDLSRDKGLSNGLDLEHINWGNYDLVVIDESHNFRNGGNIDEIDEELQDSINKAKENRYQRLMNRIIRSGVKTKVLMLSATPVNNRFNDLKNQLQLAYEGNPDNINAAIGLDKDINDVFRNAQTVYNKWARLNPKERTTDRLLNDLSFDFFQVLDAVTIARSRRHIVKYYDTKDIGNFPKRLPPISQRPKLAEPNDVLSFTDITNILETLNLAIYTPSLYIYNSLKGNYSIEYYGEGLSIDGREKGLRKLMATNLLKRLESSIHSFRLTVKRIEDYIRKTIELVDEFERTHGTVMFNTDEIPEEIREDDNADLFATKRSRISMSDMDTISWKRDLNSDLEKLAKLRTQLDGITPEHDNKLQTLIDELKNKFAHPINDGNKKVLIFTAFADTADYLYTQLADRIKNNFGLNVALVTGTTDGRTTIKNIPMSFNNILTYFSPLSKDRVSLFPDAHEDIDVLIATDCISEGQNLQDCDYLINYDIHWNPVRIIQRFGRIDRIGSHNAQIQLVNYWPDMKLDDYINLKGRVECRMKATVLTATGDDNLLSPNEKGDLEYRRDQLERLQKEVVDIEDMDSGISIMDLGLNEFRLDLLNLLNNQDIEHAPYGMDAVVSSDDIARPGVIFVLKNRNNEVNINQKNLLHPFYMVYMADNGEVISDHLHPRQTLDIMRHTCVGKKTYDSQLCSAVNSETDDGRDMSHFSSLLQKAVSSIISVKEESDINSLFSSGETTALKSNISGLDDFELISFLIIHQS